MISATSQRRKGNECAKDNELRECVLAWRRGKPQRRRKSFSTSLFEFNRPSSENYVYNGLAGCPWDGCLL
ncbi:hypothetical protein DUNSADRAFT_13113 [Dunaliella salina]|uniref:Encoded protein n=1 Tax=Dunaliella salina TaxID=3046 RepID=A0ABQ7GA28_DUNSA|nr:hypothetical protein DUNSADRAFT_13113 [Dunaliella salina]|eukprot:KAF5831459.1 hypothetical protein DUNSADRAFT_13113 [Dunaliella salina]